MLRIGIGRRSLIPWTQAIGPGDRTRQLLIFAPRRCLSQETVVRKKAAPRASSKTASKTASKAAPRAASKAASKAALRADSKAAVEAAPDAGPEKESRSLWKPVQLRNYQEDCIKAVLDAVQNKHKRLGISLATGSGKTVIFTQLIDRLEAPSEIATQTLILAHRRELVEQATKHCMGTYPDKTVEIEMGNIKATGAADIIVASMQTMLSGDRIDKFDPRRFKLVLVDEAHHVAAPGYMKILAHFGLEQKREESPILVGVSATFSRSDGVRLGAAIDEIVYHKDYVDMIEDKWLSDVIFTTVRSTADLSKVRKDPITGDFRSSDLSEVVNTDEINDITVRSWLAIAADRKSTIAFCVDLNHVAGLTRAFRSRGIDARFVTSDTHKTERSARLEGFRNGEFPVMVNCGVFIEGTDIPNIDCVLLGRPTRSRNLLIQMIGRGMRLHEGKKDCHMIDMVSSLETGIVTTPTLFGLDPAELVQSATAEDMRDLKDRRDDEKARYEEANRGRAPPAEGGKIAQGVTFVEYRSVFDLIADTSSERHVYAISKNAWVQVAAEKYILSGPNTFLRLEKAEDEEGLFEVWETRALPRTGMLGKEKHQGQAPYAKPRRVLTASTFIDAVHGADSYAATIIPHALTHRHQQWRNQPATEGQLKFLNRICGNEAEQGIEEITKGKAVDMITKLRHGARGRYAMLNADKRRRERAALKLVDIEAKRARQTVTVGPLLA